MLANVIIVVPCGRLLELIAFRGQVLRLLRLWLLVSVSVLLLSRCYLLILRTCLRICSVLFYIILILLIILNVIYI